MGTFIPILWRENNMEDRELSWSEIQRKRIADYRIFSIDDILCRNIKGREASFYQLKSPDWVTVIPRSKEGDILMVRQFRFGSLSLSLEFPAGVIDPGEDPLDAAKRELREETGYLATKWTLLGKINPNPAFMSNQSWTFLAEELEDTKKTEWDENEILQSLWKNEKDISDTMGLEELNSAIMVQAWYWYRCRSDSNR